MRNFKPCLLIGLIISTILLAALPSLADGRINVVHHFGGDVLYCVDESRTATNDYEAMLDGGGLQLLNMNGELLLFVPAAAVQEKVAEAQPGGGEVLVAEGHGTYGPVAIYVYKTAEGIVHFIFIGMDEHGKHNRLDSEHCLPVNPPANDSEPVAEVEDNTQCAEELGQGLSQDELHEGGFDIWDTGGDGFVDEGDDFLFWSESDMGLPACQFRIG